LFGRLHDYQRGLLMSDAVGNSFDAWNRRPPAFLAHIEGALGGGSGIQVDALHVVTCAHVLARNDSENFYESQPPITDVTRRVAVVRLGRFETQGTVIAQHSFLDLALLRLAKPRPGVAVPALFEETHYQGPVCVTGARHTAECFESLLHLTEITTEGSFRGGIPTQVKYDFGPREGYSGGGVFARRNEKLLLVGITTLGGELYKMGAYIPAVTVLNFLKEKLGFENSPHPADPSARDLMASGIAPTWEVKHGDFQSALPFVAIPRDPASVPEHTSFVSRRVISAGEMRLRTPHKIRPGHGRLPAWADSIEQAEAAVRRLEGIVGWELRLPTSDELQNSWRASAAAITPEGRPLTLLDFKLNDLGIEVPPIGTVEWARDRRGNPCGVERCHDDDGLRTRLIPPDQARVCEPCFRVVFDVEGT
jgi:hypothetical protein